MTQGSPPKLQSSNLTQPQIKRKRTNIYCPYNSIENCVDPQSCPYSHDKNLKLHKNSSNSSEKDSVYEKCGICFDRCSKFGLLVHCDHLFCISCIREWRSRSKDFQIPSVFTSCPSCRQYSPFIVPSGIPLTSQDDNKLKKEAVRNYSEFLELMDFKNRVKLQAYIKGELPYYPCPNPVISSQYNSYQNFETEAEENTRAFRLHPASSVTPIPTVSTLGYIINQLKNPFAFISKFLNN